jgi:hypothetical protein
MNRRTASHRAATVRERRAGTRNWILAVRVGFGTRVPPESAQVTDSNKQQKRQNRSFRRFGVHGGYTGCEFFSSEKLPASRAGGEV